MCLHVGYIKHINMVSHDILNMFFNLGICDGVVDSDVWLVFIEDMGYMRQDSTGVCYFTCKLCVFTNGTWIIYKTDV